MLDYRYETFMVMAEELSYTKTAIRMHITQPAVTQHIHYLQEELGVELCHYQNKKMILTREGVKLYQKLILLKKEIQEVKEDINMEKFQMPLVFGATRTIGDYMVPQIISHYIKNAYQQNVTMKVENTSTLLEELERGKIDFALIEGNFNQDKFGFQKICEELFIPVCSVHNEIWKQNNKLEDLFKQTLFVREEGSGSREILESMLISKGAELESFKQVNTIGSIGGIKSLVSANCGITFLYQKAVEVELQKEELKKIPVEQIKIIHPFHLVYLKGLDKKIDSIPFVKQILSDFK